MTNGSANWYCGAGCNRVGIRFSIGPLTQVTHEPLNIVPHCEIAVKWWSTTWQLVSFTFIPSSAFNYMTIGNFYNDLNTSHAMYGTGANGAYYFIDEMTVMPSIPLPVEWLDFNAKKVDGGNLLTWSTASETNTDYFRIERSDDGESFTGIGNKPAAGTAVNKKDYSFLDSDFQSHTWYYRLNLIDRDGKESRSAVKPIQPLHENTLQLFHDPSDSHKVNGIMPEEMKNYRLYVFNSQGALITSSPVHERTFEVTLPNSGVYIFNIISEKTGFSKKWLVTD